MRRPDVNRMMESMTAREYKEWEAYERAVGPLDSSYDREVLAQLHELIQINNILTGAALTKKGKKNPAGKFRKTPRAESLYEEEEEEVEDDEDEDYEGDEPEVDPNSYDAAKDPFAD